MKRTMIAVAACVLAAWLMPLQGIAQGKKTAPAAKQAKSSAGGWVIHFDDMKPFTAEDGTKGFMTMKMDLDNRGMGPYCRYEGKSTLKSVGAKEGVGAGAELIAEKVSFELQEGYSKAPPLVPSQQLRGLHIHGTGTIAYRLKEIETIFGKSSEGLGTYTLTCVLRSPTEEQYEDLLKGVLTGATKSEEVNNILFIEMTDPGGQVFTFMGGIKKVK